MIGDLAHASCTCTGAAVDYYRACATCRAFSDRYWSNTAIQRVLRVLQRQPSRLGARIERLERTVRRIDNALVAHGIE